MANRKYKDMQERIIANSVMSTEHHFEGSACWDWIGQFGTSSSHAPYPQMSIRVAGRVKTVRAHRVSYETFTGDELGNNECNHRCERTRCVAPLHLESMTAEENIAYRDRRKAA